MTRELLITILLRGGGLAVVLLASQAKAQEAKTPYPAMAATDQYMMERDSEIALARSAAPESLSRGAEIMVLGPHGYETAVQGKNGFVCMVWRSWTAGTDDPDFWNPKLRGPICLNAAAAQSQVPITLKKTEVILASRSKDKMVEAIDAAFDKKELSPPEPGAMCYMLSQEGYLSDRGGHWHPHLMFFLPLADPAGWGANAQGSPVIAFKSPLDRLTLFLVPVGHWSDGTADSAMEH
jgi:hypothetical protein